MTHTVRRMLLAGVATTLAGAGILAAAPTALADTTVTATAGVNVRSGPSLQASIIGGLQQGHSITALGASADGWTPVSYDGNRAYIFSQYLTGAGSDAPAAPTPAGDRVTTDYLNMRSGPGLEHSVVGVLSPGRAVSLTGQESGNYVQITWHGQQLWVASMYLTGAGQAPAPTPPAPNVTQPAPPQAGSLPPVVGTKWTTCPLNVRPAPGMDNNPVAYVATGGPVRITGVTSGEWTQVIYDEAVRWVYTAYLTTTDPGANSGGSVGLDGITGSARAALDDVRAHFSEFPTVYGLRPGDNGDHGNGRALDFMLADYKSNVPLGDRLAQYLIDNAARLNVKYVIWRQRIWITAEADAGWQGMADRGSDTQNHYDHVHLSVNA